MDQKSKSRNLFDIADDVYQILNEYNQVLPKGDIEEISKVFKDEFKAKADNYAYIIKEKQASIKALDEEIKRLQKRKKNYEQATDRLKSYMCKAMSYCGMTKFKTDLNSFSIRNNKRVMFEDEEVFIKEHPEYVKEKTTYTISKKDVKDALNAGEEIGGAYIDIHQTPSIR